MPLLLPASEPVEVDVSVPNDSNPIGAGVITDGNTGDWLRSESIESEASDGMSLTPEPAYDWMKEASSYYQQNADGSPTPLDPPTLPLDDQVDSYFRASATSPDPNHYHHYGNPSSEKVWRWTPLPDHLLWHSYLAGLHESRISSAIFGDTDENGYWDATLGGRVGLLRYGSSDNHKNGEGWQWDVEGAVMVRLDIVEQEDVESMDFRFGTLITTRQGEWGAKFGYFHISSHVGDEYMIRNPLFERINYVTESLILGGSYHPNDRVRVYGESALAVKRSGGAKRWQFQTGLEYIARPATLTSGSPFTALNVDLRQAVDFDPGFTVQTGWQWEGFQSGRRVRTGLQYHNGPTPQFEFFMEDEHHLGIGLWYDY
ncbi:hypothetical protein CA13_50310 [Planctomycetes bacterium CA13]|uniref:DUF1207 domain-containing protein n=1 Tax=Novipirellula herctigrandis TaxID=2527986 RepID=A0A5C5Z8J1_9BACT|nr:hypothetical protein CA13_50310 [Planctomycetes bacterium CA13]